MSRMNRTERPYDVVLFGATGFVGTLTARYLAAHAPEGLRWAIAGRDERRLRALRERLPGGEPVGVLRADVSDPASVRALARQARVVATTVGPYVTYGEELVAACADSGTDCLDLTGEPEFVDLVYVRHDTRARETGARLVHACGFDSVPHDLGVYFTVRQLPEGVPLSVDGFVRAHGTISGGTLASALGQVAHPLRMRAAARERARHEPRLLNRRVSAPLGAPRYAGEVGAWALPLPTIDAQIVARSARALARYGPDFRYRHYAAVRHLPVAVGSVAALGALAAAAQLPPARRLLTARLRPGEGPSAERRARSWFSVRFVGEGGGRRVYTEVAGGDPGYDETAKMFAEAALSLALDDLPDTAGQVTTAVALGDALIDRLRRAGVTFRTAVGG
ncbi:saccharopine dehydrogenase family protein [Streptomyces mexicanus]|uniref:Saccharopine dehydrogenase NADP-binding domain-containing protein n=1 Tax=Streptomyces mexicanus TaxID=178566 RepID=A0A7X1LQ11_9ACTN|nr:saccharopine dehydrogenase NADP-binding domain-containing protein [Streptomyces mexicanus]MBC2865463.1 saccharopine dehydrogenase NADP-binding domain-containing protein [Streptomyces mexicanus]